MLIFYKSIDKSVLSAGFTIPVIYQNQLFSELGFSLRRGENRTISVELNGMIHRALITNIRFDESKYPTHSDLLQVRYGAKSSLAQELAKVFTYTRKLISEAEISSGTTRLPRLAEDQKEFIAVYSTAKPGVLSFECIVNSEFTEESCALASLGERAAEGLLDGTDESAGIILQTKVCKIRHLSKTIANDLKTAYGYRCQICGQYIGERYGSTLIHAHHIDYFTRSLNNNANNILILCPNHHGIIHDKNPVFDFKTKRFHYPNGYTEGLSLNLHL